MKENILLLEKRLVTKRNIFFGGVLVLLLLLMRDPFGERTLIPNLEPYPDTLHYIVPARNFASGGNFKLVREFGEINPAAAPLYSILLIPFYLINSDPRMFYLLNVFLSIFSFFVFYKLTRHLVKNKWILGFVLLLYSTNYYIYWYPQWAMTENLALTLLMSSLYLLTKKATKKRVVLAAILSVSFYATKYAYPTLTFFYFLIYLFKILFENGRKLNKKKLFDVLRYVVVFGVFQLLMFLYQYKNQGTNPILSLFNVSSSVSSGGSGSSSPWFSADYFPENIRFYISSLTGEPRRFLWNLEPIYAKWIFYLSIPGALIYLIRGRDRYFIGSIILLLSTTVIFLSFFYAVDVRYIFIFLPLTLLGVGLTLMVAHDLFKHHGRGKLFFILFTALAGTYFYGNVVRLKDQIVLNLRYAEVPWYYRSVLILNDHFNKDKTTELPYVISPVIPYYIDLYSYDNYRLLPLSPQQDFRSKREKIWGPGDYSDLIDLYKNKLIEGKEVYLYTYGLGNEDYLHSAFRKVNDTFFLSEELNKCFGQCVLYKLEFKDE